MKFSIKDIGKINSAEIEIQKISVIAGENNSGKSTIGKTLYSIFNSYNKINEKVVNEVLEDINQTFNNIYDREYDFHTLNSKIDTTDVSFYYVLERIVNEAFLPLVRKKATEISDDIILNIEQKFLKETSEVIELNSMPEYSRNALHIMVNDILEINQDQVAKKIITNNLMEELNNQITNVYSESPSQIGITIKDEVSELFIDNHNINHINNIIELNTEAIYLDDPFILDELRIGTSYFEHRSSHHRAMLLRALKKDIKANVLESIRIDSKLDNILERLEPIVSGSLIRSGFQGVMYKEKNEEATLNVKNLSSGLKTFIILKTLIINGTLKNNGTLILDEPEVHLHPEWQVVLAEVIVLIQKTFDMHILITTHSPYFLRAIEVFSIKNHIADECRYYAIDSKTGNVEIKDKTDEIELIYEQLAKPFQDLENKLYED